MSLGMSLFALLLWLVVALPGAAPQAVSLVPEPRPEVESFVLFERGKVWRAERQELGRAHFSRWAWGDEVGAELLFELDPIDTRLQRVVRRRAEAVTYSWREWRGGPKEGSESGRTLVVERGPRGAHLREWAGRAMRGEPASGGTTTVELVEAARSGRGLCVGVEELFDAGEVSSTSALVLELPLVPGLPAAPRLVSIVPLDGGMRPSHWLFAGAELVAFVEGDVAAARTARTEGALAASRAPTKPGL